MKSLLYTIIATASLCAASALANAPSDFIVGQQVYVTNAHYLVGTDCGKPDGVAIATYVGTGSLVTVLANHRTSIEDYDDDAAIRVRIEVNTDDSVLQAPVGCEGWALYNYLDADVN